MPYNREASEEVLNELLGLPDRNRQISYLTGLISGTEYHALDDFRKTLLDAQQEDDLPEGIKEEFYITQHHITQWMEHRADEEDVPEDMRFWRD